MTLKQAFTIWANAPCNIVLATRSRDAVQKVLMKKYSDTDLNEITPELARRIFTESTEVQELKSKAASILTHVLQWGSQNGHCKAPVFDYSIASPEEPVKKKPKKPSAFQRAVIEGALTERPSASDPDDKPKDETNMSNDKKMRGKAPMPVAQLHPETLEVIKVWPSRSEAERELGACNLDRAIARKRMSAGFYWCAPEDADRFEPNPMSKFAPKSKSRPKPKAESKPAAEPDPKPAPDEVPVSVAASAPQSPCAPSAAAQALAVFTDKELKDELVRRGWHGRLSRIEEMTLGEE